MFNSMNKDLPWKYFQMIYELYMTFKLSIWPYIIRLMVVTL